MLSCSSVGTVLFDNEIMEKNKDFNVHKIVEEDDNNPSDQHKSVSSFSDNKGEET